MTQKHPYDKYLKAMASKNYERLSHAHCWEQYEKYESSACGIKLEDHKQCCLCDLTPPLKESDEKPVKKIGKLLLPSGEKIPCEPRCTTSCSFCFTTPIPESKPQDWEHDFEKWLWEFGDKEQIYWHGMFADHGIIKNGDFTGGIVKKVRSLLDSRYQEGVKAERERLKEIISSHNARIMNQFQLQGTPDMPIIAYDERVCLLPAITKATVETLTLLQDNEPPAK